jgi:hypothetical protein
MSYMVHTFQESGEGGHTLSGRLLDPHSAVLRLKMVYIFQE